MTSNFDSSISKDDLQRSLINAVGREDVEIRGEPKVKKATASVDGFTSTVLRVEVSYGFHEDPRNKTKVFVVKCAPKLAVQLKLARLCNLFVREGRYFQEVVPILHKVSKGKIEIPLPSFYHAVYEEDAEALYMEDLAETGFRSPAKIYLSDGFDLQHCIVGMKNLGKLHALLIAAEKEVISEKGGWVSMIPALSKDAIFFNSLPGEPNSPLIAMIENAIENILHVAKQIDGLPKEAEASGKLERVSKKIWDTLVKLIQPNRNGRNVLNHGDCWMNNIMFRYGNDSSGKLTPIEAKFIDLQVVRYCNPSIDLLYFIYLGTTKPFRDRYLDRLIEEYYDSLTQTLKVLNIAPSPFTLDELKADYHGEYKPFGVIIGIVFTPLLRLGEDFNPSTKEELTAEEVEELLETGKASVMQKRLVEDPEYRSKVEDAVKEFVDMAFPDGLDNLESSPLLL